MVVKTTISSTTKIKGGRTYKTTDTSSLAVALRASQQFFAASYKTTEYKSVLTSVAKRLNLLIEQAIVAELGGGTIKAGTGGFFPDYYLKLEDGSFAVREQKLVSTVEENGKLVRKSNIKLGGGKGVTLQSGKMNLVTEFITKDDKIEEKKEELPTTRLLNSIKKNADNQAALVRILSGKGRAVSAIRYTLVTKASTIDIPAVFQGKLQNRSIHFTWKDITNAALTRKGKFVVSENGENAINLNFEFFGSTITKALNNMDRVIIKELKGNLGNTIYQIVAEQIAIAGPGAAREIRKLLASLGLSYALKYIPGSAKIVSGVIEVSKTRKTQSRGRQQFISGLVWTVLVQKRLGETMRKSGPPNTPDLTERSGRFRSSISLSPDYRRNLLRYQFLPLYDSLEDYGYTPNTQVRTAIREVAQSLFAREFRIVRV